MKSSSARRVHNSRDALQRARQCPDCCPSPRLGPEPRSALDPHDHPLGHCTLCCLQFRRIPPRRSPPSATTPPRDTAAPNRSLERERGESSSSPEAARLQPSAKEQE